MLPIKAFVRSQKVAPKVSFAKVSPTKISLAKVAHQKVLPSKMQLIKRRQCDLISQFR